MPAPFPFLVAPDGRRCRPLARGRRLVAVIAALALVLGACGDDDDDTGATIPSADDATDTIDSAIDEFQDEVGDGLNGGGTDDDSDTDDRSGTTGGRDDSDMTGGTDAGGTGDGAGTTQPETAEVAAELRANGAANLASLVEQIDMEQVTAQNGDTLQDRDTLQNRDTVQDGDGYTLFAPNDEAFRALTQDDFAALLDEPSRIVEILRSHVVSERLTEAELADRSSIEAVSGETLEIGMSDGNVTVDGAQIVRSDITIGNTVIHIVDQVLTL